MEVVSYICNNIQYKVVPIKDYSYIEQDIETVKANIIGTPLDTYRLNMEKAVDQQLSFSVYKMNKRIGFVYSYTEDYKYIGASLYIHNDRTGMVLGLKTIFDIHDAHKLTFIPHEDGLKHFKSMLVGSSIRAFHKVGTPVVILRDTIYRKGYKVYKYLGISNG